MKARTGVAAMLLLAASGCASLSEKDCRAGDWYAIGLRDGAAGRTEDYVAEHSAACQEYGVAPDRDRWIEGRERGLDRFCTARNGYRIGEVGGRYDGVCFAGAELEFRRGYDLGLRMNEVRGRLDRVENDIRVIEGQLARPSQELSDAERERLQWRLRELEQERGYVRREHDEIEWRGRSL
ncbi:MAG: DUF2799 domain-containing protein [Steroidobacteraceae bacterium]|jgi:hypothetical protein|nr:DUF2799 domain-containing protein [Steroidobacteraceae bacterium]